MKVYHALWNVQDSKGVLVAPGGKATLDAETAGSLADLGAIEREPIGDALAPTAEERLAAVLALVPNLTVGDFTQSGQLRAESRRRIAAELGFEPSDEEIRTAGEAYTKVQSGSA